MSELKLIDTYEVEYCSDAPLELAKFKRKTTFIDNSELQIGQYVFLKDQGKESPDNGIYYVQSDDTLAKVAVESKAYLIHAVGGQKNRHAVFLWSQNVIRRLDLNTERLAAGNFVTKQGSELVAELAIPSGAIVGTSEPQTLKNKTIDILENKFLNLTEDVFPKISGPKIEGDINGRASNITGLLDVTHGGTGSCVLHANRFLAGNGVGPVSTTKTVPEGDVLGTTDFQNVTNKVINGQLNTIQCLTSDSIISLEGKKILGDIPGKAENINGVVDAKHGGTGMTNLPANSVVVTGPVENAATMTTRLAPESAFAGISDEQILTHKTISAKQNKITDLSDDNVLGLSGSKITSDIAFKSAGIAGVLPVQHGGTGVGQFEPNCFMQSGHSLEVITKKKVPLGDIVGSSDEQILSNKTIDAAQNALKNISDPHVAWLSGTKIRGNINGMAEAINGTNDVTHGGTGRQTLPLDCVLIGNNSASVKCEMKAPKSDFVGISDEQKLTKKIIDARENHISGISSANITSISGSCIQSDIEHNAKNVNGVVDAQHGGTGLAKFEAKRFLTTGSDATKLLAEKVVPIGDICGTTDLQVLKNKIMDAECNNITNISDANVKSLSGSKIVGNIEGGAAFVHQLVSVPNGGTGLKKIPKGHTLVGTGDHFCETRVVPATAFVGVSDEQILTSKILDGKLNVFTNLDDKSILSLNGAKVFGNISGNAENINGVVEVKHGGTGLTTFPLDEILVGNGPTLKFKKAPESDLVGTTDQQNLTKKIIDCQKNAILNISGDSIRDVPGTKIQGNISGNAAGIYGVLDISNGGTGLKEISNGHFLTAEGHRFTMTHKIPAGEVCGTLEEQTLKHKTIDACENKIENLTDKNIVQVSGSKVTGDINGFAAGVHGVVSVEHGGTGGKSAEDGRQKLGAAASGHNKDIKSLENLDFISFKNRYTTGVKLCVQPFAVDWNFFLPACDGPEGHVLTTNGFGISEWSPGVPCFSRVGYVDAQYGMANGRCRKTIREVVEKEFAVIYIAPGTYRETCFLKGHIKGISRKEVNLIGNFIICKGSIVEEVTFSESKISIEGECQFINCNFIIREEKQQEEPPSQRDSVKQQVQTILGTLESAITCGKKTEFKGCSFSSSQTNYSLVPSITCADNTFSECSLDASPVCWLLRGNAWLRFCRINCRLWGPYLESCSIESVQGSVELRFPSTQIIDFNEKFVATQKMLIVQRIKDGTKINGVIVDTLNYVIQKGDIVETNGATSIEYVTLP